MKPGLSRKFRKPWTGLYKISKKISDVNHEIMDQNNKSQVVHVSRPKIVHNTDLWKRKQHRNATKESREKVKMHLDEDEGDEFRIGPLPMQIPNYADRTVFETPLLSTPDPVQQMVETPSLKGMIIITALQEPPDPVEKFNPRERNPRYKVETENVTRRVKL